ncbi:hypothetical protein [Mycobacteroides abscessus]|uniref:hypothetical protein n=1 Tax=Mycobacteroides abscessus TaxID=36809 RepID=UPI000925B8EF|nr:hypothetical protein [Mycobacteroides abscessus]MBE5451634.1 hypothetical protein [Mycobacteroides abscessus]MBE5466765.1 hypothetical protein [Mycobacteroides abscessus]MBN7366751.1 hypothetical protein [Mycobacteroides abscessus subsp. abscessus]MBN7450386.1 hypothetical protein [Mycobacteroides abscessus subsp. abscessus]MBN7490997.1 hypothetical protein [Mycobacteroides abscessus subsp. abscessus]
MSNNDSELIAKYGMDQPPKADHPIIGTIQVVERTRALVTREAGDTAYLFDPAWNPDMWQLAQRTMRDMRQRFADRIEAAADSDTFLYYPCIPNLYVYDDAMERFSYMITTRVPLPHAVGERGCDVQLAPEGCSGRAVYLPHEHAPFIVVFGICRACDTWARETAEIRFREGLVWVQAQLPPGARIDPGSPVPPGF